ncbi:hypothetical protein C8R43DRAFT_124672 [Mycena crocata]|nr:hypothetical protein C8R43DRAFT_124672 [Mycena crocata]
MADMNMDITLITRELRLHDYLFLVPITFLYWDHLMTFEDEVRFLWKKTRTPSTYCFLLNRYLAFFGDIVVCVFIFTTVPDSVCKRVNLFRQILLVLNQVTICVLLTLRIYALWRDTRVWMYMLGAGGILMAVSMWAISGKGGIPVPGVEGCHIANSQTIGIHLAVPWEALFIYDIMVFAALLSKSFQNRRESVTILSGLSLLKLLIRDGAIYFGVMAVVNLGNIMTFYFAGPLLRGSLSTMASCISVTMMSRLMLNLHKVESKGIFSTTAHIKHSGTFLSDDDDTIELDTLWTRDMERSAFAPGESVDASRGLSNAEV